VIKAYKNYNFVKKSEGLKNKGGLMEHKIRMATTSDAEQIAKIFEPYVLYTDFTWTEAPFSAEDMADKISSTTKQYPWLVYEIGNKIVLLRRQEWGI
jgi:hypothetical protein